jgi:hypothetical protein
MEEGSRFKEITHNEKHRWGRIMQEERRRAMRRHGDEFLEEALATLQTIERLSRGEDVDYTEYYVDLVGMKNLIGRRHEDHLLGELICSTIESIADNIDDLLKKDRALRQVKLTKHRGKPGARVATNSSIEGWEAEPPSAGKSYRIYTYNQVIFSTSPVVEVGPDYFQTQNSVYGIKILQ